LRVAARDSGNGNVGSVVYDLDVPDFAKAPLSLSGVVISSAAATVMPTARPDEGLKTALPGPPVATREFPRNDQVAVYFEVYEKPGANPHSVEISAVVTDESGQVVFRTQEKRPSSELQTAGGNGFMTALPIKELAPGDYVLRVEAHSLLGSGISVDREVAFRVTPPVNTP
jgi:hypothetical protein